MNNNMENDQSGPLMFMLYLVMMFMAGLLLDCSNTGMRDKLFDLECDLTSAKNKISELEQTVVDREDKIEYLEQTLDNLRDALQIHTDVNNPNKRRRVDYNA